MASNSSISMELPPSDGAKRLRLEVLVALDGGEPHLAVQLLHLLDAEVAELVVIALDEAERLVRPIELEQPPVPSVHAREVVDVYRGVFRAVLLIEPRQPLRNLPRHQLLHVFLRFRARCPEHLALAGKAEWRRRASSSALLPAKQHRSEDGSRESMTTSANRSEAEVCAGSHGPLDAA